MGSKIVSDPALDVTLPSASTPSYDLHSPSGVGAAKSGTTSLYRYLGQHPDVFTASEKEPHFFAFEGKT